MLQKYRHIRVARPMYLTLLPPHSPKIPYALHTHTHIHAYAGKINNMSFRLIDTLMLFQVFTIIERRLDIIFHSHIHHILNPAIRGATRCMAVMGRPVSERRAVVGCCRCADVLQAFGVYIHI